MAHTKVSLTKETWTKVADNVITGNVWRQSSSGRVLMQSVATGDASPTDLTLAVHVFDGCNFLPINSTVAIDVYMYAVDRDVDVIAVL